MESSVKSVKSSKTEVSTTKGEVVKSKKASDSFDEPVPYKSLISAHQIVIYRSQQNQNQQVQRYGSQSYGGWQGSGPAAPEGVYKSLTSKGVNQIMEGQEQEKRDMQELNLRLAQYIESMAHNRELERELEELRGKRGKETAAVKAMYEAELDEARRLLSDAATEKARLEIRVAHLEEQDEKLRLKNRDLEDLHREDVERLQQQFEQSSQYEADLGLLRKRIDSLEIEHDRDRKEIARLQADLNTALTDLNTETLNHFNAESRLHSLEEELEFLRQVHAQELKELTDISRKGSSENREYLKKKKVPTATLR